jgi:hypothetical protein
MTQYALAFYAPEHVRTGCGLLGHKHLHTGEKFYACAQTVLASRLVADILEDKRALDQRLTSPCLDREFCVRFAPLPTLRAEWCSEADIDCVRLH